MAVLVAREPRPRLVRAPAGSVAPVPPLVTGTVPVRLMTGAVLPLVTVRGAEAVTPVTVPAAGLTGTQALPLQART